MVEELPKDDGNKYAVCLTCAAMGVREDKDVCDESKLDEYSQQRKVSRYKPSGCPKDIFKMASAAKKQITVTDTAAMRHKLIDLGRFKVG